MKVKNPKDDQPAGADHRLNIDELKVVVRWRIVKILALDWQDVELDAGTALTRAESNKGRRDSMVALDSVIVDAIRPLKGCQSRVFPWNSDMKDLYSEFHRLQAAAEISLE